MITRNFERLNSVIISPSASIAEAIAQLDKAGTRALVVCSSGRKPHGLLTDGDIRRALLHGDDLTSPCGAIANRKPIFTDVPFRFSEAVTAMRCALDLPSEPPCDLEMSVRAVDESTHILEVRSKTPTFGPQPWLALKTSAGTYHYDNFDIQIPFHSWQYVFDEETYPLNALSSIGVAANNSIGVTTVVVMEPETGKISREFWNQASSGDSSLA